MGQASWAPQGGEGRPARLSAVDRTFGACTSLAMCRGHGQDVSDIVVRAEEEGERTKAARRRRTAKDVGRGGQMVVHESCSVQSREKRRL